MTTNGNDVDASAEDKPTLHHLNNSQSQRILWLLEELAVPYNLVLYKRDPKSQRAPPELATVHPLGKSPILVTTNGTTIVESSAIATYLLKTYDTSGRFSSDDWLRDEMLTSFAGASLGLVGTLDMIFALAARKTPWPLSYLPHAIYNGMHKKFTGPELNKFFTFLETELRDQEYFNGTNIGRADVMLIFPFDSISQNGLLDLQPFPRLRAWSLRIQDRPAWRQGLEKGNGYELKN